MGCIENYDDLPMNWVGDWAGRRAALTPHRTALYDSSTQKAYTFQDMNDRASRVGTYLTDVLGLRKGDVLTLICRNRIESIDLYLACGKLGIILAPLSQRLKKPELDDLMARLQPRVLVHEHALAELVSTLSVPASVQSVINIDDDRNFFENVILKTDPREVNIPLAMKDRCLYVHTGGTTATPKFASCLIARWSGIRSTSSRLASPGPTKRSLSRSRSFTSADGTPLHRCFMRASPASCCANSIPV